MCNISIFQLQLPRRVAEGGGERGRVANMTQFKLPLTFVQWQPHFFVLDSTKVQGLSLSLLLSASVSLSLALPLSPHALSCFVRFIVIVIICACVCV